MSKRLKYILTGSIISCSILYLIEQILLADYFTKTASKIIMFVLMPLLLKLVDRKKMNINKAAIVEKHNFRLGILFGAISFLIVMAAYFVLAKYINIQGIISELQNKSKITPANFLFIGTYITLGNSFLEEFFFRGFIFLKLYESGYRKTAYVFSSFLFGLYHISIFRTWFNIWLILLALLGLVAVGFIFDWLDTKSNNFINSWIVHIFADSAIILIGMKMFSII